MLVFKTMILIDILFWIGLRVYGIKVVIKNKEYIALEGQEEDF